MLAPKTLEHISNMARSGCYAEEDLVRIFCQERYAPGALDPDEVAAAVAAAVEAWRAEQASWPPITDCDRLNAAFANLTAHGVIALHNAGYTQSDGYDDFLQAYRHYPDRSAVVGYCFYTAQDLERAVRGEGLMLAFGPANAADEVSEGPSIGANIQKALERAGLEVAWDGTFSRRIHIPHMVWQRR